MQLRPRGFDPADIAVPVLLLHGRRDQFVPAGHGEWLASHMPGVEERASTCPGKPGPSSGGGEGGAVLGTGHPWGCGCRTVKLGVPQCGRGVRSCEPRGCGCRTGRCASADGDQCG
jgi:hypothetical protein